MIAAKKELIVRELEEGTGASIGVTSDQGGLRSAMRIWFADLDELHGPAAEVRPHGLKAHRVQLNFGRFSGAVVRQIQEASAEDVQLARALVATIHPAITVAIRNQSLDNWTVADGSFHLDATIRHEGSPDADEAVTKTCREVIVPVMAAMAELIGYEVIHNTPPTEELALEGAVKLSVVKRRERNPRNRLLCIRLHGETCLVCGLEPRKRYGEAGGIIEVHHLQPLSELEAPRSYDPAKDLAPLCPSCHRAVHRRTPLPWSINELKQLMEVASD